MDVMRRWFWAWLFGLPLAALAVWGIADDARRFLTTALNGLSSGALYFLVASGFSLVFGLMRNVNLAHGSLYLIGAYVGWEAAKHLDSWLLGIAAGFLSAALIGLLLQVAVFRHMHGQDLRQTMTTIAISIIVADILLWNWGGEGYPVEPSTWATGQMVLPVVGKFPIYRLILLAGAIAIGGGLWLFLVRTRVGMMIRAGVDDRAMLAASGVNVQMVFAVTFAIGAGLAGFAGVLGSFLTAATGGEDTRYLLVSLMVVIVGGMGSVPGAALGAVLVGLAEQFGLTYTPTYSVVFTFVILALVLAFRPQGILGRPA